MGERCSSSTGELGCSSSTNTRRRGNIERASDLRSRGHLVSRLRGNGDRLTTGRRGKGDRLFVGAEFERKQAEG